MAIRCGNCHQEHTTPDEVRGCYTGTSTPTAVRTWEQLGAPQVATQRQQDYLRSLLNGRDHGLEDPDAVFDDVVTSRKATSNLIDVLSRTARKPRTEDNPHGDLADGIYRKDGVIYRVYHTVHGANVQVASRVNVGTDKDASSEDKFTYLGQRGLVGLTAADLMPFEEAVRIASAYEWCIACGTVLHNDKSVELGIGPICRRKFA